MLLLCSSCCSFFFLSLLFISIHHLSPASPVSVCPSHFASATPAFTRFPHFSPALSPNTHKHTFTHPHTHTHTLFGCLCSTGSKSLAAACSSPNLPSLCTIALGTKLGPHNSRPVRVNSRANTVKAKTHFLLSPPSLAKN